MSSKKSAHQDSLSPSERDGDSTQDSETMKIKDEPVDAGYEKNAEDEEEETPIGSDNNSNSNSRSSSPCPPVHFGSVSPSQEQDSPSHRPDSGSSDPASGYNDLYGNSTIRTQLQGTGKKTDTVQNIVEGLLKKNATLLAMSDAGSLRPQRRYKNHDFNNGRKDFTPSGGVFPVSANSQARLVPNQGKKLSESGKPMLLRPKSPTKKCDSILRDKSQLSYSLMESPVGDETIENIFKVQKHELVCAVSSKSFVYDKALNEKRVVASIDNTYFWCNFCSFSSSNKSLITNHIMDHRFSCKFCAYESFCRSDILRHMSKLHEEFEEISNNLTYCTFLSDYIRTKTRADGKENGEPCVDPDEDVEPIQADTMKLHHTENLKRKREREESQKELAPAEKVARTDSSDDASNGPRQGKSRKSQNPRRHPQVNEKDYDTFEMEVEEIDEAENGNEQDRATTDNSMESYKNSSPAMGMSSHMQLIPSLQDEGATSYTATTTHFARTPPLRTGRLPSFTPNNRGGSVNRSTNRSSSASSLYWSCGYCDFQSSSQAEIKEHSNRTHPGKPHRYVALIKNMNPDSIINKNADKNSGFKASPSTKRDNSPYTKSGSFSSVKLDSVAGKFDGNAGGDDVVSLKNDADDSMLKVKFGSSAAKKKEATTYKCYHCNYTAKRHSSMKSHIYYKHRGKGLLAVDEDSATGQQVFFCARDDCTFKSIIPTAYLAHVEQCTPWHKPELADVEVEPHIRECLQQTLTFAEMALDKQ